MRPARRKAYIGYTQDGIETESRGCGYYPRTIAVPWMRYAPVIKVELFYRDWELISSHPCCMMALLLLLSLLFYKSARSDIVCDVGKPIIDHIPSTYLQGTWTVAFVRPKGISKGLGCWADEYTSRADGGTDIFTSVTYLTTGERLSSWGTVDIDGHFLTYNFSTHPSNWISFPEWPPSESNLRAALDALNKTGLRFEEFESNC
ncbi:uncharacterized protein [Periplaneta americana]|uniref:uncharacterized protein isoform X6 n=1 Tax=Periplaneta americana TaxID=6978 RepID=UPI0037E7F6D9